MAVSDLFVGDADGLTYENELKTLDIINSILKSNSSKNFVKRILDPDNYPKIKNEDGTIMSHMMAWGSPEESGKPIVYPTVIQDEKTGALKRLDDKAALDHALKTGEYIPFGSDEEADWFSKNYKRIWEQRSPEWEPQVRNDTYRGFLDRLPGVKTQIRQFKHRDPNDAIYYDPEKSEQYRSGKKSFDL